MDADDQLVVLEAPPRNRLSPHTAWPACDSGKQVTTVISKARIARVRDTITAMQAFRFYGPGDDPDEISAVTLGYRHLLIQLQRTATPLLPEAVATRLNSLGVEPEDLYSALNAHAEVEALTLDVEEAIEAQEAIQQGVPGEEGREKPHRTGDGSDSSAEASELIGLSSEEQVAHMVDWFRRMYEHPVNQTPYDGEDGKYVYVWGGPFDAHDELVDEFDGLVSDETIQAAVSEVERDGTSEWAPTDGNPKHAGGPDDDEEERLEPVPPTLDDIRQRLARGMAPRFGDPIETQSRDVLRSEIDGLRRAIEDYPSRYVGIGHNRPPESISLTVELIVEVKHAATQIDEETARPVPNVDPVVESTGRLEKVLGWLERKLDASVDSFVKTIGALAARAGMARLAELPLWEHIAKVYRAVLEWLDEVLPLF